ncbi:MAG TPA: hypothetical protein VLU41_00620, partial [Ideonella sp.]|nr:hypothetical protein [Ideonella sp.]
MLERAWAQRGHAAASPLGLTIATEALGAILEGWQDYAGSGAWAERLASQLDARGALDADARLQSDAVCLRAVDILQASSLGARGALVAAMLGMLEGEAPSAEAALAAAGVLMESAGYATNDEALFGRAVRASQRWLARPGLSPLLVASWLTTYGPLGRRWPVPGVKLPAATPIGCVERALELAREFGAPGASFGAAQYLANAAIADNDRVLANERLSALRDATDLASPTQSVNLLVVEAGALALAGVWPRARDVAAQALALARQHGFPASQQWSSFMAVQRIAIATGAAAAARAALLAEAARWDGGVYRELTLVLADVALAAQAVDAGREPAPELLRAIVGRARELAWPGFATLLAPLAATLCAAALAQGIEPAFVRHVVRERRLAAPVPHEPHWPWPVRLHVLGGLRIEVDGAEVALGARAPRKPLDLLKAVVAHGPAPVDAALVLDALWSDAEGGAARAAFDMAVLRLRKLLGREDAVRLDAGRIGFDTGLVWVDAWAFASGASDAYPGALFGHDAVQPWWAAARERLAQRFLRRVRERALAKERAGAHD